MLIGEPKEKGSNEIIYINGLPTIREIEFEEKVNKLNNKVISIPIDPPGVIGQDCIKLKFTINDFCEVEIEGIDLRNNNTITTKNLGPVR